MSKYDRFGEFLRKQKAQSIRLSFDQIEKELDFELPASCRFPAWWSNNATNSVMTKIWLAEGWRTKDVDIEGGEVTFFRTEAGPRAKASDGIVLEGVSAVSLSVLSVLAKRSGRSLGMEAGVLLNEILDEKR